MIIKNVNRVKLLAACGGVLCATFSLYAFAVNFQTTCPTEGNKILCTGTQQECIKVGQEHAFQYGHQTVTKPVQ